MNSPQPSDEYRDTIRTLSDRLVEAQRPIRILDAIKWDATVHDAFFASGCDELPPVDAAYYANRPLGFDPAEKLSEFHGLEREILRSLGSFNPVGGIMRRMCHEYSDVVRMLDARGTPEFSQFSQQLYGSPNDVFHAGDPTLADLGTQISEILENVDRSLLLQAERKDITGEEAVEMLQERLDEAFPDPDRPIRVMLSDGIISDAAAGTDYLKVRKEARFNARDIRLLEVHEGWVHVGTTRNGMEQPYCTFLSKGPPSSTVTQEGLAIVMEILAFASHPGRMRRVTNRIRAVAMAEGGADFLEIFRFFREEGFSNQESYTNTSRVFRGSTPTGGPFTKDISYSKGFILVYNYIQLAVRKGLLDRVPLLFCGKTNLGDMRTLAQLVEEGLVVPPRYLPPHFADMNALVSWMCYSDFLNRLNLDRIDLDFGNIF